MQRVYIVRRPLDNAVTETLSKITDELPQYGKLAHEGLVILNWDGTHDFIEMNGTGQVNYQRDLNIQIVKELSSYTRVNFNDYEWTMQKHGESATQHITSEQVKSVVEQWISDRGGYSLMSSNCQDAQRIAREYAMNGNVRYETATEIVTKIHPETERMHVMANSLGKSFNKMTENIMNYAIEHVPSESIDTSKSLIIHNDRCAIEFEPSEVKFMTQMIHANQKVRKVAGDTSHSLTCASTEFIKYSNELKKLSCTFDKCTRRLDAEIDGHMQLINTLNLLSLIEPKLRKVEALPKSAHNPKYLPEIDKTDMPAVNKINDVNILHQKVAPVGDTSVAHRNLCEYIGKLDECTKYNAVNNQPHMASVGYDDSHGWRIGFSVNYSYDPSSRGGGGGFSCVIL